MNISLDWLKEYVDLDEKIEIKEIADRLTMTGSKVEKYEQFGRKTTGVYTGIVEDVKKHEQDAKVSVVRLKTGDRVYTAVAKIPDLEIGDIVPVALPGADIINKKVEESEILGVKSECMICHVLDLGLDLSFGLVRPSGLLVFPKDVPIGADVSEILGLGDYIIEFEITPNRPDCLSVEGIASELALTFNTKCKPIWQYIKPNLKVVDNIKGMTAKIESDACRRYTMSVVDGVEIVESDYITKIKLLKTGIRPINNIVDITNLVMLELGQPIHAFDKDKLNSNQIIVRDANEGEEIVTLDDVKRTLTNKDLVITTGKDAVAIAGVMGGNNSSISSDTKSIVLESANFVRASIRNTSKNINLRTDASSNYEKGLPTKLTEYAMSRLIYLIQNKTNAKIDFEIVDIYNKEDDRLRDEDTDLRTLNVEYGRINHILGTNISKQDMINMLNLARIEVSKDNIATIPYFREDISITEDLAEEIARIYGYDKLDSKLPTTSLTVGEKTPIQKKEEQVKEISVACGYSEIYTYTFFSEELLAKMDLDGSIRNAGLVKISNPLSKEFEYMRNTSMPHMLEALERNYTRKNQNVKLFELGKIFLDSDNIKKGQLCREELVLTLGTYDDNTDYYDFKNDVFEILNSFKILEQYSEVLEISRETEKIFHSGVSAKISIGDDVIAKFGRFSPMLKLNYTLPDNTYIAQIYFDKIVKYAKNEIRFEELPKYPAVERDLSFVIDKAVLSAKVEKAIKSVDYVERVKLFDVYDGSQIESGKKSMAYNIYIRSREKTLNEEDIKNIMQDVVSILETNFDAMIRK